MGAGTTGVACKELNRNFIGFEIQESYVEFSQNRISQYLS
jgi:site-specific DNA-methyltransferase (adenine-specific)